MHQPLDTRGLREVPRPGGGITCVMGGPGHAPWRRRRWIAGDGDGARPDPTGSWAGPISVAGGPRPDPADRGRTRPDGGLVRQTPRPGGSLDGAALGHHATPTPGRPGCYAPSPGGGGLRRVRPGLLTSSATRGLVPKPVVERRSGLAPLARLRQGTAASEGVIGGCQHFLAD